MAGHYRFKVLHPDPVESLAPYDFEREELAGCDAELVVQVCQGEAEIHTAARDADVLLVTQVPITASLIAGLPASCRLIARYGIGTDTVDLAAATRRGIMVTNTPTYCIDEVSTHAAALVLALVRQIPTLDRSVRQAWTLPETFERVRPIYRLQGRTVGILGLGKIGRAFALKMGGFGVNLIAWDPYVSPNQARTYGVTLVSLADLLARADILSIHAPLTDETRHMIGAPELARMKPSALLVNTGRGAIVDEEALARALAEGRLAGAGLDVLAEEPPRVDNLLLQCDNVIFGHHFGSFSEESTADARREVCQAICAVLQGRVPPSIVNPEVIPAAPGAAGNGEPRPAA